MKYDDDQLDLWRFNLLLRLYQRSYKKEPLFKDRPILNVGAGEGRESYFILLQEPKYLILLDINFEYSKRSRQYLEKFNNKYIICADTHNLPLKDKSVSVISVAETFHHLTDPYRAVVELIRVAKQSIVIDGEREGKVRDVLEYLFFKLGIRKKRVEFCDGQLCTFRIDLEKMRNISLKYNLDLFCYPYFIYYFEFYKNTHLEFIKMLYKFFLIVLNMAFHRFGNRVIIVLHHKNLEHVCLS